MYHLTKLQNGIAVITVPVAGTKATTALCLFPIGSRYETRKLSGASHFVEHMLFKGTPKRPTAPDISKTLERAGADYNAYTFKDYTGYYVKIASDKQELAFDLLSDMIFHSKIEAEEVEKEKGAIVEELRMYLDNPTMAIDILADHLVFGNHPLGWDIGGTEATVRGITRAELWKYYERHYHPRNLVLVVAGNVQRGRLKKYLQFFSGVKVPKNATTPSYSAKYLLPFHWPKKHLPLEQRIAVEKKKVDQAHVILTFPGLPQNHPDRYAASLMLNILGSGMSSRLFVEVREKRGLAYMIKSGAGAFRDVGVSYVQAGLDPARLPEALQVIRAELERMAHEPVTTDELEKAKSNSAGRLALALEDSSTQAEWYAKQYFTRRSLETPEDFLRKLNKVTREEIKAIAVRLLKWDELRLAVIGPMEKGEVMKMVN